MRVLFDQVILTALSHGRLHRYGSILPRLLGNWQQFGDLKRRSQRDIRGEMQPWGDLSVLSVLDGVTLLCGRCRDLALNG